MHLKAISNLFDFEMDSKPSRELVAHYATNKNGLNNILVCRAAVYLLL
jgi:hypothetical protein